MYSHFFPPFCVRRTRKTGRQGKCSFHAGAATHINHLSLWARVALGLIRKSDLRFLPLSQLSHRVLQMLFPCQRYCIMGTVSKDKEQVAMGKCGNHQNSRLWHAKENRCATGLLSNTAAWCVCCSSTRVDKLEKPGLDSELMSSRLQHPLLHHAHWANGSFLPLHKRERSEATEAPACSTSRWTGLMKTSYGSIPSSAEGGYILYPPPSCYLWHRSWHHSSLETL